MQFIKKYEEFSKKQNAFIIRVERDFTVKPKTFPGGKYLNYYIRIFIDIDSSVFSQISGSTSNIQNIINLGDIKKVIYHLHKSYHEPIRVAQNADNKFEIKVWSYGFYPIKATLFLKYGHSIELHGEVKFPVDTK
ncbi:hypothetical protein I5M27_08420 [Adhaeribacter sp. BT258]|uniref:Prokaryotic YEATS domain-containing protein n=1 Tax=Adhaeribacter terrigena TaxID=2793070 RepID=A0ABS1C0S2_9BACT|nr:pYEATS domain-containing protein [Adhaeribacter terrigena]MBK0403009.1 hypothetical protein [Adhaeribacter terrigena]